MEIISTTALISINETFIVQLISFLIFLFIMNRIMFRPLKETMEKRNIYMEKLVQDIKDAEDVFENLSYEIKQKKEVGKKEALQVRKKLEEDAKRQVEEITAGARSRAIALHQDTEHSIGLQLDTARALIRKEAETVMVSIIEKILNRRLDP